MKKNVFTRGSELRCIVNFHRARKGREDKSCNDDRGNKYALTCEPLSHYTPLIGRHMTADRSPAMDRVGALKNIDKAEKSFGRHDRGPNRTIFRVK